MEAKPLKKQSLRQRPSSKSSVLSSAGKDDIMLSGLRVREYRQEMHNKPHDPGANALYAGDTHYLATAEHLNQFNMGRMLSYIAVIDVMRINITS